MLIKRTVLSLILLTIAVQAETSRREPSLFLEYEREVKKANDSIKDEDPFIKNIFSIAKPTSQPESNNKPIAMNEPIKVLKNTKVDDKIGDDNKAFLVITKPSPITSAPLCSTDEVKPAETPKSTPRKIIKNFKNAKEKLLTRAKEFLGTPYSFGDNGDSTDCSGFTQQVYRSFGVSLPHSATEQAMLGEKVSPDDLQVGDLLFYRTYKSDPSHVAIYAGNNQIIHASFRNRRVQYDSMDKGYYKNRFMYAKRLALNDLDHDE
ncbi:C40 family peptidase [Sulfuricurvum sp.]|uniref:C40 family peptidase n=1 Tax=Sulfuricurvum sp. TaxID=2025608 RepID=UPI002E2ED50B|nr:C40 family peptidase [Sulfuricurvum sp.]HEX5330959.1 C40 family peptidase [Sulfuricurvum sp.]